MEEKAVVSRQGRPGEVVFESQWVSLISAGMYGRKNDPSQEMPLSIQVVGAHCGQVLL